MNHNVRRTRLSGSRAERGMAANHAPNTVGAPNVRCWCDSDVPRGYTKQF